MSPSRQRYLAAQAALANKTGAPIKNDKGEVFAPTRKPRRSRESRRPVWGSQEWAETRGDDIGLSPDF